jgi:hypothetical protein
VSKKSSVPSWYFELRRLLNIIVITKAANMLVMQSENVPSRIDDEQVLDGETARQLARVIEFLLNIED